MNWSIPAMTLFDSLSFRLIINDLFILNSDRERISFSGDKGLLFLHVNLHRSSKPLKKYGA